MSLFFSVFFRIVSNRTYLEGEVEFTLAFLLAVVQFSLSVLHVEKRVGRITDVGSGNLVRALHFHDSNCARSLM